MCLNTVFWNSLMTLFKPMQYMFSHFDIKYGTYSMFTWHYAILHLISISYSVVNVNLSMAVETNNCQYVFLMKVLTLPQLLNSSQINIYRPCMCWGQKSINCVICRNFRFSQWFSGWLPYYCMLMWQSNSFVFPSPPSWTINTIHWLEKIQDLHSGESLDYFLLGNNILYSGGRLWHGVSWYLVITVCSLEDGYNTV
jgi:hypothetical protein